MKIVIKKNENEDILSKININGVEEDFDYIKFIDNIYNGIELEDEVEFVGDITEWEKEAILKVLAEIKTTLNNNDEDLGEQVEEIIEIENNQNSDDSPF